MKQVKIKISFIIETNLRDNQEPLEVVESFAYMLGLKDVKLEGVEFI